MGRPMNAATPRQANETFDLLLTATREQLLNTLTTPRGDLANGRAIARALGLTFTQMVCGVGFNPRLRDFETPAHLLGFEGYEALAKERNRRFTADVYERMGATNLLSIYQAIVNDPPLLGIMQYLLPKRLATIEGRIETTVNALVIERYRKEIDAVYRCGVAGLDFTEARLADTDSGFRALLGEVSIIVEHRILPIGDLFFRDTVLVEEKRRLIQRGLVPRRLIEERLHDSATPRAEREMLSTQLAHLPT